MHAIVDRRATTLLVLELVESVTALASLIAGSADWNGGLGQRSVDLVRDTTRMLHTIGTNLFSGHVVRGLKSADDSSWWTYVQATSFERYQKEHVVKNKPALIESTVRSEPWSMFDNRILNLGLRCLQHAALILRLRAADASSMGTGTVAELIDFASAATVFCSCANLLDDCQQTEADRRVQEQLRDFDHEPFDVSNSFILETLQFVVENTMCVIYYIVSVWAESDVMKFSERNISELLDAVLLLAEKEYFAIGSVTRSTARWIKEKRDRIPRLRGGRGTGAI
jgi:hypothetical protein